jgi:hypothetical protein
MVNWGISEREGGGFFIEKLGADEQTCTVFNLFCPKNHLPNQGIRCSFPIPDGYQIALDLHTIDDVIYAHCSFQNKCPPIKRARSTR